MPELVEPKRSFKAGNEGKWYIACFECAWGINGDASCPTGLKAKDIKFGCYKGKFLDKFLPYKEEVDKGER